jgi:hypothetical protein
MSRLFKLWTQFWCVHRFYIEDIRRNEELDCVTCHCHRCQKLFTAPYGLALPGFIERRPT